MEVGVDMSNIITVDNLSRDYRVANRDNGIIKFMFSREYKIVNAVKDINFSVKKGELVGFIGPNGAGKSTTIKMLSGILSPSGGSVSVMGNDPFKFRRQNAYNIGVVFGQRSQLWWDLPVGDTFLLLKKLYRVSDDEYNKNIENFKKHLDLNAILRQPVRQLSLGQRMRAEIAAAILHNPKLLFLDEPTIGLDIVAKRQIREFILKLNSENNTTVILTTHDMKDIEEICNRIILIDNGTIVVDSAMKSFREGTNRYSMLKVSFKHPVTNFDIDGTKSTISEDGHSWLFEVDRQLTTVGHVVYEISKITEIEDIEIIESAIEDIIHDIYKDGI